MVATTYQFVARLEVSGHRIKQVTEVTAPSGIIGLTVSPDRRQIAIGLARNGHLQLVVAEMPRTGETTLRIVRTLRSLPVSADYTLIWR